MCVGVRGGVGELVLVCLRFSTMYWMYRLVCICFPTPGRGLPYGSGLGLSRCLGPGECLHSFIGCKDLALDGIHVSILVFLIIFWI